MATLLCLDDFTYGLSGAVELLRENGYQVLAADDNAAALDLAATTRWMPSFSTATTIKTTQGCLWL